MHAGINGTYPMLYAFFGADGAVQRAPFKRQIEAAISAGASGVSVLGLATEVGKLGRAEQREIVEWIAEETAGRLPFAVTVADGNVPDMISSALFAANAGAQWLILQPPRPPISGQQLIQFFAEVAAAVDIPVAVQNAPEFLGVGLTTAELLTLNERQANVCIVKAEAPALAVACLIEEVGNKMAVFNGRAGLELTDNYRAGCIGMVPGIETIDLQVAVQRAMTVQDEERAEDLYRQLLPCVTFVMQGLPHLVLYAKIIAAHRLNLPQSTLRNPSQLPTAQGLAWAARLADTLGPLA